MTLDFSVDRLNLAVALALLLIGAAMAWASSNAFKRGAGAVLSLMGAMLGLAAIGAPSEALMACGAVIVSVALLACVFVVRLQEAYGAIEIAEIDAADQRDEPAAGPQP